jgi:hypothetical protein
VEGQSSSEFIGAMIKTLADLEGMREGTTEHPRSIPPVRR